MTTARGGTARNRMDTEHRLGGDLSGKTVIMAIIINLVNITRRMLATMVGMYIPSLLTTGLI